MGNDKLKSDEKRSFTVFDAHPDLRESRSLVCPLGRETAYEYIHPSGARLIYVHKECAASFCAVSVPYGGDATHISSFREQKAFSYAGCAHFAEHMLFTGKGGRLERFLALGADANAYTTPSSTVYSFTCDEREGTMNAFTELMRMVLSPTFDEGQTEKEREIILRELSEDDDIFSEGRKRLTGLLFSRGSVRRDVGGAPKYVKRITPEMLRKVYAAAYIPSDFCFTLVSNIGAANARAIFESNLLGVKYEEGAKYLYCRSIPKKGKVSEVFRHKSGSRVLFAALALNTYAENGHSYAERYVYTALLESMIFDRTEPLYLALCSKANGIYGEFVSDTEHRREDSIISANLMCEDPVETGEKLRWLFGSLCRSGELFVFANFEAKRRAMTADYLSILESPSELSLSLAEYAREGDDFFGVADAITDITKEKFKAWAEHALEGAELVTVSAVGDTDKNA